MLTCTVFCHLSLPPPFSLPPTPPDLPPLLPGTPSVELNADLCCLPQMMTDHAHAEGSVAPMAGIKTEDGSVLDASQPATTQPDSDIDTVSATPAACTAACASANAAPAARASASTSSRVPPSTPPPRL